MRRVRRTKAFIAGLTAVGGMSVLCVSCNSISAGRHYETRLQNTGEPAMHAVHNERLREIMADMNRLKEKGDYDHPLELKQKYEESVQVAESLLGSVERLPALMQRLQMSDAEKQTYLAMVEKLKREAAGYLEAARQRDLEALQRSLEKMVVTCNACHNSFRKMN